MIHDSYPGSESREVSVVPDQRQSISECLSSKVSSMFTHKPSPPEKSGHIPGWEFSSDFDDAIRKPAPNFNAALGELTTSANNMRAMIEGELDYKVIIEDLLSKAKSIHKYERRQSLLSGALITSLMAGESERWKLLDFAYEHGYTFAMADAIARIEPEIEFQDNPLYDRMELAEFAYAFSLPADSYRLLKDKRHGRVKSYSMSEKKALQAELVHIVPGSPQEDVLRLQAKEASICDDTVADLANNPLKIEMYALHQAFIEDQQDVLLGDSNADLFDSPFARTLADSIPVSASISSFSHAIVGTFFQLSKDVVQAYHTNRRPGLGYDGLTDQQRRTVRYRELIEESAQLTVFERFVNPAQYREQRRKSGFNPPLPQELWSSSQTGSALPGVFREALTTVLDATTTGLTPEELRDVLHDKRVEILHLARQHLANFQPPRSLSVSPTSLLRINRDADNNLRHSGPLLLHSHLRQGLTSAILGCPAIDMKQSDAPGRQNWLNYDGQLIRDNFIDKLLFISIETLYRQSMDDRE